LDPDLAVTNKDSDRVSILTGGSGGSFSAPANITVGDFPVGVAAGDFNGDLDLDLAVTNQSSSTMSILVGGIGAGFSGPTTLAGGARAVAVGDFNRDGDPDLAVGGNAANNLSIFVGGIGASFGSPQIFPAGGVVESVAVGDFDAEGRPDIAVANYFAALGSTLLNTSDLTAPNTTISPTPPRLTNDTTPSFSFSSSEPAGATFECRVYSGAPPAFSACTSPHTTATLADGSYTFEVRAIDAAGNVDATPAARNVTVDTAAPDTTITGGPSGPTNDNTPTFTFSSPDTGATFQCRVDAGAFAACTSPHTTATLADGAHTFDVRAIDAAGNVDASPATRSLTVDAAPPDTSITSGPSGPVNDPTPTFAFSASEAGSTFECRVDTGAFTACTSPHTTAALADGAHTFEVRAVDPLGNADPTAVSRSVTVDTVPPETTIVSGPTGEIDDNTPTFEFSSSEADSTFQCKLDSSPFVPCSTPFT
ncbi:MAG: Ig-like domain-containing protein, partial [Pseudonocardiaceae bacterium]